MPVQGPAVRNEVWRVLFWEENVELRDYTLVQTPKTCESQPGTNTEFQRYGSSKKQDLIEALHQEKEDMAKMLLYKISSLKPE